jgi:hypothetical protein
MTSLNDKSSSTSDPAMVKSEATTAVPSQNVSSTDLPTTAKEENDAQPLVVEAESRSSPEPTEKTEEKPTKEAEESTAVEEAKALDKPDEDPEIEYPHGLKLAIITLALCLSVFLVALVSTLHHVAALILKPVPGQYYHCDCHSKNNRPLQNHK